MHIKKSKERLDRRIWILLSWAEDEPSFSVLPIVMIELATPQSDVLCLCLEPNFVSHYLWVSEIVL